MARPTLPCQPQKRPAAPAHEPAPRDPVPATTVWGLSLARFTCRQTLDAVDRLVDRGAPSFFITANLHYAMLSHRDARLREVNRRAAFLVADGMPLVWYSRLTADPLPERVAGSDLIYLLAERAAVRGHRVFMLGGGPAVGEAAAAELRRRNPALIVAGIAAPDFGLLSADEHARLIAEIRQTAPDLLLVALGQPKGELWLSEHCESLGVPACVQLGASFDFVCGRVRRAPRWAQRAGLEWAWRMSREPRRLLPRYAADAAFLARAMAADLWRAAFRPRSRVARHG